MFDTAITNILNPEMIAKRIVTNQAFRQSEIWKNSEGPQNSLQGLKKGRGRPRKVYTWAAKLYAFFRTKQVQDRLSARPEQLSKCERQSQNRLKGLRSGTTSRQKSYFKTHVIWYSKFYPGGLRFEGDGCSDPDDFPYDEINHPAIKLQGVWKTEERRLFEVLW